ncbi:alpha/beta fold hydrolase [Halalkalibacter oceani]|uniref:alpha/beta fold hydrolase n=1 Tax=Halalkalibacter oceani TaxID=1653776 RepID=UPI00339AEBC4
MCAAFSYTEEKIDVKGTKVRLLRAGKGKPILWLHGANGGGWNPFLEELSLRYEILAPDHPGFSESEKSEDIDTIDDLAFHYRDFLDAINYERVSVCGNSIGGWLGLQFSLIQSHRVNKLIVCNAAGVNIPGKEGLDPFGMTIHELFGRLFYDKANIPNIPPLDEMPIEMLRNRAMHARLSWQKGYDRKLLKRLQGLDVETLIVWGRHDELIPVENGEKLHKAIPQSVFTIIEECGHLPYVEKPHEFLNEIVSFVD